MGLFEVLLIAVVALLVVGPERMPEAVRSTMLTIGRVKRMVGTAFQDIEKQVGADEIRQQLHNEDVMKSISEAQQGLSDLDNKIDQSISETLWTAEDQRAYEKELEEEDMLQQDSVSSSQDSSSIDEPKTPPTSS